MIGIEGHPADSEPHLLSGFGPAWIEANMPVAELWQVWLTVWGVIKRAGKIISTAFLVLFCRAWLWRSVEAMGRVAL